MGPGDRCEGRREGSRLRSFSHQLLGPSLARMLWSASHALCRGEKTTHLADGKVALQRHAWGRCGEGSMGFRVASTIQNGQALREGRRTKQDTLELGSNRLLISHQLPRLGVADSPTTFTAKDSCQNHSCPMNFCYNHGHCDISEALGCQPICTCPPAFTDNRCFLAGNNFTPTIYKGMANCSCQPQ